MTFKYLNLHPEGKSVEDCVKRAITAAMCRPYKEVALELNRYKKVTGVKDFNDKRNWQPYLLSNKFVKISFPAVAGEKRMDIKTFCEKYPKGTYVLQVARHVTACVDGVIYDTWVDWDKCVYIAYRAPKNVSIEDVLKLNPVRIV